LISARYLVTRDKSELLSGAHGGAHSGFRVEFGGNESCQENIISARFPNKGAISSG
jgi:hypothetical protein